MLFAKEGVGSNFRRAVHSGACGDAAAAYRTVQRIGIPLWPGSVLAGRNGVRFEFIAVCELQMVLRGETGKGS